MRSRNTILVMIVLLISTICFCRLSAKYWIRSTSAWLACEYIQRISVIIMPYWRSLTHGGQVMTYSDIVLGQHWRRSWLVAWWYQAITWYNVDFSSVRSCGIYMSTIVSAQDSILCNRFESYTLNIGSNNGLLPIRCQDIIWTSDDISSIIP